MWIECGDGLLNLDKIAFIYTYDHTYTHTQNYGDKEIEKTLWYIYYFTTLDSHHKWLNEEEEREIEYSLFSTEEERDTRYEEIKAMIITKPPVELF